MSLAQFGHAAMSNMTDGLIALAVRIKSGVSRELCRKKCNGRNVCVYFFAQRISCHPRENEMPAQNCTEHAPWSVCARSQWQTIAKLVWNNRADNRRCLRWIISSDQRMQPNVWRTKQEIRRDYSSDVYAVFSTQSIRNTRPHISTIHEWGLLECSFCVLD